jgi:hypothetical protein
MRASVTLILALLATLWASVARADPPAPGDDEAPRSSTSYRLAVLADQRNLLDLSVLGGGIAFSVGSAHDKIGGQFEMRAMLGRTAGGLSTFEVGVGGSGDFVIAAGAFIGVGGGLALFGVERATDGSEILSVGPDLYGRVGYRFGKRMAPFVALDLDGQLHVGSTGGFLSGNPVGTFVWGPTLVVGYQF